MMTTGRIALVALGAAVILTGCATDDRNDKVEVEVKTDSARQEARDAGDRMEQGARNAGAEIKQEATEAGQAISDTAQNAAANLDETKQEVDIRAALAVDTTVDRSNIDVVGDAATTTIKLTGTVPTAEQKARAEVIARDKAQGWTIVNELQVSQTAQGDTNP